MVAAWRPDLAYQKAFNADPNGIGTVPSWVDFTNLFRAADDITYGQQYELQESQAASPTVVVQDVTEYLNPANTSSPYYPNVDLYRRSILQAIWPNDGTLVNYLNTGAPVPAMQDTYYDPSFESSANGAVVSWLTAIGATVPVVSTTNPRTGTKDISYSVAGTTAVQGISWPVPCIPGREYTASAYVRQSTGSTQSIRVTNQNTVIDDFRRTTASGWGSATFVGGAWTNSGGSAADYSTALGSTAIPWYGTASQSNAAVNTAHVSSISSAIDDTDQYVLLSCPVVATGGSIRAAVMSRFADTSNYYFAEVKFGTDTTVVLDIQKRVAGANTSLTTGTAAFTYAAGVKVWVRFQTVGPTVRGKVWIDGTPEPSAWTATVTDTAITAAGGVGLRSILDSANTNTLPVALTFQQYTVTGSVAGSTTTTTGAYARLSVTWTATQPVHTIQLATSGTATAGAVLVDDLQHEQGSSATTFTSTGPVIYTSFSDYVERWPAQWQTNSQGFEGIAEVTLVDSFAPLNKTTLLAAYPQAALSLNPAFYWPLWDSSGSVSFAEISGNNGSPLTFVQSKFGAGTLPEAAGASAILGDPAGTGVTFTTGASPGSTTIAATVIGAGQFVNRTNGPTVPAVIGTSWALTGSAWIRLDATGANQTVLLLMGVVGGVPYYAPLYMYAIDDRVTLLYQNTVSPTTYGATAIAFHALLDGTPHHLVGVVTQDSTNTVLTLYIDGTLAATSTTATATLGGVLGAQATNLMVGGTNGGATFSAVASGVISHVAVWNRALSATEIAVLGGDDNGAGGGWSGETSGERITRYLTGEIASPAYTIVGAYATNPVDIDEGMSVMGPDDLTSGTDALTACQNVNTTENGQFWAAPTALTFAARSRRYLKTTSKYTFGDGAGEYHYMGDPGDLVFEYDPTTVYNQIVITNADGIVATAYNSTSVRRYFGKSYARSVNVLDDNEAIDAANYTLAQYDRPRQRVAELTFNPTADSTLWPMVLALQINDRVTVKRRPKAANAGAGLTMSGDYFVSKITHTEIRMGVENSWQVRVQLTPVDLTQVWILDDTTYSILGASTILGY